MFKRYLAKIKEFAAPLFNDISRRQFLVTTLSAVVMLGALIVFWNYFILPHENPAGYSNAGVGEAVSGQETGTGSVLDQGQASATGKDKLPGTDTPGKLDTTVPSPADQEGQGPGQTGEGAADGLPENPDMSSAQRPLEGKLLRKFGFNFSPIHNDYRFNGGIDIGAGEGTAVKCALDGIVEEISSTEGLPGSTVTVNHGGNWKTVYGNLVSLKVKKGSRIASGAVLGYLGPEGTAVPETCSLHLQVLEKGEKTDPLKVFHYEK